MPPQWGGGRLFGVSAKFFFFTKTAVTRKRKVEKSILRCEMDWLSEGYKRAIDKIWGSIQVVIPCGAIEEASRSSKALDQHVIINFLDKNIVTVCFRDKK